jgi:hypothetical protein
MKVVKTEQTPEEWAQSEIDYMLSDPKVKKSWDNIQRLGKEIQELKNQIEESKKNKVVSLAAIRLMKESQ